MIARRHLFVTFCHRFMLLQLEDLVDFPFTILYVHTDTSYAENCPGLSWMQHKMSKYVISFTRAVMVRRT